MRSDMGHDMSVKAGVWYGLGVIYERRQVWCGTHTIPCVIAQKSKEYIFVYIPAMCNISGKWSTL